MTAEMIQARNQVDPRNKERGIAELAAKLNRANNPAAAPTRTTFNHQTGKVTTTVPRKSAVMPTVHEMTSVQQTNARAEALGYVKGSDFAQRLGLLWTEFCTAVRTGVVPKPVITRDGNDYFDAADVAHAVATRRA